MAAEDPEIERIKAALNGPERSAVDEIARRWGLRGPPEVGIPAPVTPSGGPRPFEGGAEAPLDYD